MTGKRTGYIYAITHTPSGSVYVGMTRRSTTCRWEEHLGDLKVGRHHSQRLQESWDKDGISSLVFGVISVVSEDAATFEAEIRAAERRAIFDLELKLNSHIPTVRSVEKLTKTDKRRFLGRKPMSAEQREKIGAFRRETKASEATREKMSATRKGRQFGPGITDAVRAKSIEVRQRQAEERRANAQATQAI
jgi:hypothetical protein